MAVELGEPTSEIKTTNLRTVTKNLREVHDAYSCSGNYG